MDSLYWVLRWWYGLLIINIPMSNEFKQKCGAGYYWCSTDKVCKPLEEDAGAMGGAPANAVGGGAIAGLGVGSQGEPGVKKRKTATFISFIKRKTNVAS